MAMRLAVEPATRVVVSGPRAMPTTGPIDQVTDDAVAVIEPTWALMVDVPGALEVKLSGTEPAASVVPVTVVAPAPVTVKVTTAPATGLGPTPSFTVALTTWVMPSVLVAVTGFRVMVAGAAATQVMASGLEASAPEVATIVDVPEAVDVTLIVANPEGLVVSVTVLASRPVTVKVTGAPISRLPPESRTVAVMVSEVLTVGDNVVATRSTLLAVPTVQALVTEAEVTELAVAVIVDVPTTAEVNVNVAFPETLLVAVPVVAPTPVTVKTTEVPDTRLPPESVTFAVTV
jgi:hypothetical protein